MFILFYSGKCFPFRCGVAWILRIWINCSISGDFRRCIFWLIFPILRFMKFICLLSHRTLGIFVFVSSVFSHFIMYFFFSKALNHSYYVPCCILSKKMHPLTRAFAKALCDVGERFQILAFSGSVCLPSSGSLGDVGVVVLLCLRDNGGSDLCEPNRPTVCSLAAQ